MTVSRRNFSFPICFLPFLIKLHVREIATDALKTSTSRMFFSKETRFEMKDKQELGRKSGLRISDDTLSGNESVEYRRTFSILSFIYAR